MTGPVLAGTRYRFGPYALSLPEGWTGERIDGIHQLLPDAAAGLDCALHISGFARDRAIAPDDLQAFAAEMGAGPGMAVTLASGLDGITFDLAAAADETGAVCALGEEDGQDGQDGDAGQDPADQTVRHWLIRDGQTLIAVSLTAPSDGFAAAALAAQMIVATIAPVGD